MGSALGCQYCGKEIGPLRLLRDKAFCCAAHRRRFQDRVSLDLDQADVAGLRAVRPHGFLTAIPAKPGSPQSRSCLVPLEWMIEPEEQRVPLTLRIPPVIGKKFRSLMLVDALEPEASRTSIAKWMRRRSALTLPVRVPLDPQENIDPPPASQRFQLLPATGAMWAGAPQVASNPLIALQCRTPEKLLIDGISGAAVLPQAGLSRTVDLPEPRTASASAVLAIEPLPAGAPALQMARLTLGFVAGPLQPAVDPAELKDDLLSPQVAPGRAIELPEARSFPAAASMPGLQPVLAAPQQCRVPEMPEAGQTEGLSCGATRALELPQAQSLTAVASTPELPPVLAAAAQCRLPEIPEARHAEGLSYGGARAIEMPAAHSFSAVASTPELQPALAAPQQCRVPGMPEARQAERLSCGAARAIEMPEARQAGIPSNGATTRPEAVSFVADATVTVPRQLPAAVRDAELSSLLPENFSPAVKLPEPQGSPAAIPGVEPLPLHPAPLAGPLQLAGALAEANLPWLRDGFSRQIALPEPHSSAAAAAFTREPIAASTKQEAGLPAIPGVPRAEGLPAAPQLWDMAEARIVDGRSHASVEPVPPASAPAQLPVPALEIIKTAQEGEDLMLDFDVADPPPEAGFAQLEFFSQRPASRVAATLEWQARGANCNLPPWRFDKLAGSIADLAPEKQQVTFFPTQPEPVRRRVPWRPIGLAAAAMLLATAGTTIVKFARREVANAAPVSQETAGSFAGHSDGALAGVRRAIANRAAVEVGDTFQSGMEAWGGVKSMAPGWKRSPEGYVEPGQLAFFHPSMKFTNYRMQFFGQIESQSMDWVVRAHDANNYYAMKFTVIEQGLRPVIAMVHYPVINGKPGRRSFIPLNVMVHNREPYQVDVAVQGSHIITSVEGQEVDRWIEDSVPSGGVGFFSEAGERSRLYWMKVSKNSDLIGKICAYLTRSGDDARDVAMFYSGRRQGITDAIQLFPPSTYGN